jgi:hypothetical protein
LPLLLLAVLESVGWLGEAAGRLCVKGEAGELIDGREKRKYTIQGKMMLVDE